MRFINKKRVVFLSTVACVLLALIAVWIFMFWQVKNSSIKFQDLAAKSAQAAADREQSRKLIGVIGDAEPHYVKLIGKAVSKEGIVPFIENLEQLGSRSGTSVNLGSINAPEDSSSVSTTSTNVIISLDDTVNFGHVTLNVSGVGEWANIMKLLKITENLPYALHIDKVRISKSAAGSTILVNNSSSGAGDAIPVKIGQPKPNSAVSKPRGPVELWNLQFELTVLKII